METKELKDIHDFLLHAPLVAQSNPLTISVFKPEWDFLVTSEEKLKALMSGAELDDNLPGDAEYGSILYLLHQGFGAIPLKVLGMPDTTIDDSTYASWLARFASGGVVMKDGTLISTIKFAVLDPQWAIAFVYYLRNRYADFIPAVINKNKQHKFITSPNVLPFIGPSLKIAILGDWGTGKWADGNCALSPAELVNDAILALGPDIVIHLGDVYYYGSDDQEQTNLLETWKGGAKGSFTLNSNHEMYDGANGYYKTALTATAFGDQNGTSYFCLTYEDWLIFGLDSAYFDRSALYSNGTVSDEFQKNFISSVLSQPGNDAKKVIILTHHNPIKYDGTKLSTHKDEDGNKITFLEEIRTAFGKSPDYWYYGHLHNGIVYNAEKLYQNPIYHPFDKVTNFRCLGHGGIPAGRAHGLDGLNYIDYYTKTPIPNSAPDQSKRVLNGFAMITLGPGTIKEQIMEVANKPGGGVDITTPWEKP